MRTVSQEELREILDKHLQWLLHRDGERANLSAANLSGLDLVGVNLQHANLQDTYLQGADLRGANLSSSDLRGAHLEDANLREACMRGIDLRYANLSCADLCRACLDMSCLVDAKLYASDLSSTSLKGVDLRGADLGHVILHGAFLYGVCRPWFRYVGAIDSRYAEILYFADIDSVKCGCWHGGMGGTLAEFRERVNEIYPSYSENKLCQQYRLEYLLTIDMFGKMREAYLEKKV